MIFITAFMMGYASKDLVVNLAGNSLFAVDTGNIVNTITTLCFPNLSDAQRLS